MPYWFAVVVLLWTPFICLSSIIIGAYIMWCKERGANPLTDVKTIFMPEPSTANKNVDETIGFYD